MTKTKVDETSLSDLPHDLLELIVSHILRDEDSGFRSLCCFQASCKSFLLISTDFLKREFPTLVYLAPCYAFINCFNPLLNSTAKVIIPDKANQVQNKEEIKTEVELESSDEEEIGFEFESSTTQKPKRICFARDGWLLMYQGQNEVFFFNPFTKERIDLPDVPITQYEFDGWSFSSAPTSSDCIVFGIIVTPGYVKITFICRGDSSWTGFHSFDDWDSSFYWFENDSEFSPSYCNPIFHNGLFYVMGETGNLGVYDPKKGGDLDAWRVLDRPENPCTSSIEQFYLTEYNGELAAVFIGHFGNWISVCKLDHSTMAWVKMENLEDNMLFLSRATSFLRTRTKARISGLENTIYFPRVNTKDGTGVFYSLDTSKFHTFWTGYASKDYYGTREFQNCAWTSEPNNRVHNDDDLNWLCLKSK